MAETKQPVDSPLPLRARWLRSRARVKAAESQLARVKRAAKTVEQQIANELYARIKVRLRRFGRLVAMLRFLAEDCASRVGAQGHGEDPREGNLRGAGRPRLG